MSHKTKELFIKRMGITESDVKTETDKTVLMNWLVELNKISSEVKDVIFSMKVKHQNGEYSDPDKFASQKKYARSLGAMRVVVQNRLSEINREEKEQNKGRIEHILIDVFREILPELEFDRAYNIAIQRAAL